MVFNYLLICIDLPSVSSTFQHLQVRGCCHDVLILGDLGEGRMQLDGRAQELEEREEQAGSHDNSAQEESGLQFPLHQPPEKKNG